MLIGSLIKTTLVDYPTRVAATYFISGCNIRCPYCYNTELVLQTIPKQDSQTLDEVYSHLEKRKAVLSGFVISGGEPLIHDQIPSIIKKVKAMGYKVKLDTNGLFPEKLHKLFSNSETRPDYIAIDIKTSPTKYDIIKYSGPAKEKLLESIDIIKELPNDKREFRTVLCPPLVSSEDIPFMAELLPPDAAWYFAQFRNENCLDPTYNNITPYTDNENKKIVAYAKTFIKDAKLR